MRGLFFILFIVFTIIAVVLIVKQKIESERGYEGYTYFRVGIAFLFIAIVFLLIYLVIIGKSYDEEEKQFIEEAFWDK